MEQGRKDGRAKQGGREEKGVEMERGREGKGRKEGKEGGREEKRSSVQLRTGTTKSALIRYKLFEH